MDRLSNDVGSTDFSDYGARLRRRWWIVALGLLLGLLGGLALNAAMSKTYTSTTSVLVAPTLGGAGSVEGGRTSSSVNLDTESQIVRSAQVADAARTLLRTETSVAELTSQLQVTVPPNSSVLQLAFEAGSPQGAQQGSHAFAQAYLTARADQAKQQTDAQVANLQAQIKAAQDQLQAASDRAAALVANSPEKVLADAQRQIQVNQVNDLLARLAPLQADAINPGRIITDAPLPTKASSPVPELNLGAGLLVGLLLGLALAALADRADHRVRRPADVQRQVGLPVLASVPATGGSLLGDDDAAVFDRLRNTLTARGAHVRTLQVSDPGERGASGLVAVQLARSFVRARGGATLVVAHPGSVLPAATGSEGLPGLAEVLRGERTLAEVGLRVPQLPGVVLVPPGRDPRELESLLQSSSARELLDALTAESPALVLETTDPGRSAAAQALGAGADVLLLVAERGRTDARVVRTATQGARDLGGDPAGVVLVEALSGRRTTAPETAPAPLQATAREAVPGMRDAAPGADQPLPR